MFIGVFHNANDTFPPSQTCPFSGSSSGGSTKKEEGGTQPDFCSLS